MNLKYWWCKHQYTIIAAGLTLILIAAIITLLIITNARNTASDADIANLTDISHDRGEFGENVTVHDSSNGEILIQYSHLNTDIQNEKDLTINPVRAISDPEMIWESDYAFAGKFTIADEARLQNGSLGVLSIPDIKMSANVYESTDTMEDMRKGIAHFPSTSAFVGNIGLSAHNINLDGSDGYFKNLYLLEKGDTITYTTALGTKTYSISSVSTISENDWSPLSYTDDNRVTLITCISGQRDKRLCVQALEIQ